MPHLGLHYTQRDPSRSNLPRDPETGKIRIGPAAGSGGNPQRPARLAKGSIADVFERLGGTKGMVEWAQASEKNLFAFYVHIYPRLMGAQALDAAAARLGEKPTITRIENLIVNARDGKAVDVPSSPIDRSAVDAEVVRSGFADQAKAAGATEDEARAFAGEIPL